MQAIAAQNVTNGPSCPVMSVPRFIPKMESVQVAGGICDKWATVSRQKTLLGSSKQIRPVLTCLLAFVTLVNVDSDCASLSQKLGSTDKMSMPETEMGRMSCHDDFTATVGSILQRLRGRVQRALIGVSIPTQPLVITRSRGANS